MASWDDAVLYPVVWAIGIAAFVIYWPVLFGLTALKASRWRSILKAPLIFWIAVFEGFLGYAVLGCITWDPHRHTADSTPFFGFVLGLAPVALVLALDTLRRANAPPPERVEPAPPPALAAPVAPPVEATPTPPAARIHYQVEVGSTGAQSVVARALWVILIILYIPVVLVTLARGSWINLLLEIALPVCARLVWKAVPQERKDAITGHGRFVPGFVACCAALGIVAALLWSPWRNIIEEQRVTGVIEFCVIGAVLGAIGGLPLGLLVRWLVRTPLVLRRHREGPPLSG